MATRLLEYDLEDGGSAVIEVQDHGSFERAVARDGDAPEKAGRSLNEALQTIKPTVAALRQSLSDLDRRPDQTVLEFGVGIGVKASAFIASGEASANFRVRLTWDES